MQQTRQVVRGWERKSIFDRSLETLRWDFQDLWGNVEWVDVLGSCNRGSVMSRSVKARKVTQKG